MLRRDLAGLQFTVEPTARIAKASDLVLTAEVAAGAARNVVGIRGAISSNVKLPDHAARSIG
jgi:hypothetical protein